MLAEDFCCLHSPAEEYVSRTSAFRRTWLPPLVKDFLFPRGPLPSRRTSLTKDLLVPRGLLGHLMAGENHWQDPTPASFELLQVKGLPQILQMDTFWRDIFGTFLSRSKSSLVPAAFWDCHTFANVLLLLFDWDWSCREAGTDWQKSLICGEIAHWLVIMLIQLSGPILTTILSFCFVLFINLTWTWVFSLQSWQSFGCHLNLRANWFSADFRAQTLSFQHLLAPSGIF